MANVRVFNKDLPMKNEPLKQWQQDVEDYGDNAYLMWQWCNMAFNYEDAKSNNIVNSLLATNGCKRKQSAELPFDLERAKAGDEVQYIDLEGNLYNMIEYKFHHRHTANPNWIVVSLYSLWSHKEIVNLCMKYPPRKRNEQKTRTTTKTKARN